jgi:hypothetical protein
VPEKKREKKVKAKNEDGEAVELKIDHSTDDKRKKKHKKKDKKRKHKRSKNDKSVEQLIRDTESEINALAAEANMDPEQFLQNVTTDQQDDTLVQTQSGGKNSAVKHES